jgi:ATP-dependent Clp protease adaptor protein ClpS
MQRKKFSSKYYENPEQYALQNTDIHELKNKKYELILWNDDVNTFDFVIKSLIEICDHTTLQAEQCAFLVHYKGKYIVKTGTMEKLQELHKKLLFVNLTSEIITK